MIRSIETGQFFQPAFTYITANFQGKMIEAIDGTSSGNQLKQTAKIIAIVVCIALAAAALIWIVRSCCFKASIKSGLPPNSPKFPNSNSDDDPSKDSDFSGLLQRACESLEALDKKLGPGMAGKRWNLAKANHEAFLNDIRGLKSIEEDYKKFETYADRLDDALKPYHDEIRENKSVATDLADFIQDIYCNDLEVIYLHLAKKYFSEGNETKAMMLAAKIQYNEAAKQEILLVLAKAYFADDRIDEALQALTKAAPSALCDKLCEDHFRKMIVDGHYDQAVKMLLEAKWNNSDLEEKLKTEMAEIEFTNELAIGPNKYLLLMLDRTFKMLKTIKDGKKKDQLLVKLIRQLKDKLRCKHLAKMMTFDTALRDRILNNIDNNRYATFGISHPWLLEKIESK